MRDVTNVTTASLIPVEVDHCLDGNWFHNYFVAGRAQLQITFFILLIWLYDLIGIKIISSCVCSRLSAEFCWKHHCQPLNRSEWQVCLGIAID